jgi:hypothetical protein
MKIIGRNRDSRIILATTNELAMILGKTYASEFSIDVFNEGTNIDIDKLVTRIKAIEILQNKGRSDGLQNVVNNVKKALHVLEQGLSLFDEITSVHEENMAHE